jgi:hypothetical protein
MGGGRSRHQPRVPRIAQLGKRWLGGLANLRRAQHSAQRPWLGTRPQTGQGVRQGDIPPPGAL